MTVDSLQNREERKVEPIRNREDIGRVRTFLAKRPRDLLLFDILTQSGIEINRLLSLKVKDFMGLKVGDTVMTQNGNKPAKEIEITETIYSTWQQYLQKLEPDEQDYLIKSRNVNKPLNVTSISNMVADWYKTVGLNGLTGTKSLRKTWELHYQDTSKTSAQVLEKNDSLESIEPIKSRKTITEIAYEKLFRGIIMGKIKPGERLVIDRLARSMNVSNIPLREALARLETAKFIRYSQQRTYVVNELSQRDMKQLFEVRTELEIIAAKKAISLCSEGSLHQLESIHRQYTEARKRNDVDEYLKLNRQFHFAIYRIADNSILDEIISGLWDRAEPYRYLVFEGVENNPSLEAITFHEKILEGMKLGDSSMVAKWLKKDLAKLSKQLFTFFQTR